MLYIVATPIGNRDDLTFRALEILKAVDVILCEDTRVTKKLLDYYDINNKELISFNEHTDDKKLAKIDIEKDIAFLSDAGTPNVSDPGAKLVSFFKDKVEIVPLPGASAITTILSISDVPMDKFVFLGFPPAKKKRQKFFEEVANATHSVIIYESPHRILKTLEELKLFEDYECVIGRELTKKFETIYRGKLSEVIPQIKVKGEFVLIIKK